ncbi:MAG: beta strand repeat-containing protein [Sphingobacteriales bacterium]
MEQSVLTPFVPAFGRHCNNSQSPLKRGIKNLARAAAMLLFIFTGFVPVNRASAHAHTAGAASGPGSKGYILPYSITSLTANSAYSNAGSILFTITFNRPVNPNTSNFSLTTTGVSGASIVSVSGSGTSRTITVNTGTGEGTIGLNMVNHTGMILGLTTPLPYIGGATTMDYTPPTASAITFIANGANGPGTAIIGDQVTLNFAVSEAVQAPLLTIAGNTVTAVTTDNINYSATYIMQASDDPDLSENVPYTIGITDPAGNTTSYSELTAGDPNVIFLIAPTIRATGTLSALRTSPGTASASTSFNVWGFNLSDGVLVSPPPGGGFEISTDNVNFSSTVTVGAAGAFAKTPVYVRLAATDAAGSYSGNIALTSTAATEVDVATTSSSVALPTTVISIAPVGTSPTNATTLDYTVSFAAALSNPPSTGDFSLSGTASGTINTITTTDNINYDVNVTNVSGDGTLELDMTGGSNAWPNISNVPFSGGAYTIDQALPTATISAPSVASIVAGGAGTVTYTVSYADADFNTSSLTSSGITLNSTGTAAGTVAVTGSGTSYTVTISGITGAGTLGISVAAGYASDLAGNTDAGAGPSATFTVVSGTDATLSALSISSGTLSPVFDAGTITYTASVPYTASGITVTPTTNDAAATVTVNGTAVISGTASGSIALTVGANTITTIVTAQDGSTTDTYTLTVTMAAPATDATLSNLISSGGSLNQTFASSTTTYTESVPNATNSITITPATNDPNATVMINGAGVTPGTASGAIGLNVGSNTITIISTAQDGVTTDTYTLTVTRAAPATNAALSHFTLTPATALTQTTPGILNYTGTVSNATASVTVTPTTVDPTATVTVNGTPVASGTASGSISLNVGANTITLTGTAQNGITTKTYTVTVTRAASANAALSHFTLTPTTTLTQTTPGVLNYTGTVSYATASVTVTPTTADPTATVTVNGTPVTSGTASGSISLNPGANTITLTGTAPDNITTKTYTLIITRAASTNAALSRFALTPATALTQTTQGILNYTGRVSSATASVTVTPTTADPTATVTVNGTPVTSGTASGSISLNPGANTITLTGTAQDNITTKTYTLIITRAASSNAALSHFALTPATALTQTTPGILNYTGNVKYATASVTVTPTTVDPTATVTVNGTPVTSGTASGSISLNVGANTITLTGTAQDGVTTKTYTLTITRATGPVASLDAAISVAQPSINLTIENDGILVHQGLSPNGDGVNDFLMIDGIAAYPENKLTIINRNGALVYQAQGYDNSSKVFDGHASTTGAMQVPGTYFYALDYSVNGVAQHKTGFIILKY